MPGSSDTIFAAATGTVRAAVSVIRVSGGSTREMLRAMCGSVPEARRASLRTFRDGDGEALDRGLALWFPASGSYTGEDCAELHIHGGRATMNAVGRALVHLGARPAEPGEFTRRAFLNGKCDLIEAEAIGDLVASETDGQRRQALRQLEGDLGAIYRDWATQLREQLARAEASIDFGQEDPEAMAGFDRTAVGAVLRQMEEHLADGQRGQRLRDGLVFAVVGLPNVGKSSLVNRLTGREIAIVDEIAGTTRDVLEARVIFGDVPVTLLDTAGLRATADPVEAEGARRALESTKTADLVLHIQDASAPAAEVSIAPGELLVANKIDLGVTPVWATLGVSAHTGEGLSALRSALDRAARDLTNAAGPPPLTQVRHRAALSQAVERLAALEGVAGSPELAAEELRSALHAIGRVTGHVAVDDVLETIFRQFCIGK